MYEWRETARIYFAHAQDGGNAHILRMFECIFFAWSEVKGEVCCHLLATESQDLLSLN